MSGFIIETKSKSFWKRLFRETDKKFDVEAMKAYDKELWKRHAEAKLEMTEGCCPFTKDNKCSDGCNHFNDGGIHPTSENWWAYYEVILGEVVKPTCKMWRGKK